MSEPAVVPRGGVKVPNADAAKVTTPDATQTPTDATAKLAGVKLPKLTPDMLGALTALTTFQVTGPAPAQGQKPTVPPPPAPGIPAQPAAQPATQPAPQPATQPAQPVQVTQLDEMNATIKLFRDTKAAPLATEFFSARQVKENVAIADQDFKAGYEHWYGLSTWQAWHQLGARNSAESRIDAYRAASAALGEYGSADSLDNYRKFYAMAKDVPFDTLRRDVFSRKDFRQPPENDPQWQLDRSREFLRSDVYGDPRQANPNPDPARTGPGPIRNEGFDPDQMLAAGFANLDTKAFAADRTEQQTAAVKVAEARVQMEKDKAMAPLKVPGVILNATDVPKIQAYLQGIRATALDDKGKPDGQAKFFYPGANVGSSDVYQVGKDANGGFVLVRFQAGKLEVANFSNPSGPTWTNVPDAAQVAPLLEPISSIDLTGQAARANRPRGLGAKP